MRLPEFFTSLSPTRETLSVIGLEEGNLAEIVAEKNRQLSVSTAESGLFLWEMDYALPALGDTAIRRARIRGALAGGKTLTVNELQTLAITVGGADQGVVEEDFPNYRVILYAVFDGRQPTDLSGLREIVSRLKPAHLSVEVHPVIAIHSSLQHYHAKTSKAHLSVSGQMDV